MKGLTIPLIVCWLLTLWPVSPALAQAPTGEIVFNRDGGIYIMSADGSHVRQVTDYGLWPAWSPDGTRIAFGRWGSTWCDIWVMFVDGNGQTIVAGDPVADEYHYTHPTWSPDGREVIYSDDKSEGVWEQDWSPDGQKIVSSLRGADGQVDIYVENRLTGTGVNLTDDPANDWEPAWSPDGTKIAFASNRRGNYDIYVINADGSGLQRLMENRTDDREPVWSPDGTQLAFTRIMPNGNGDIFIMNRNGGNQINITKWQ
jgi:Tol biopolymer transport system component